MRLNLIAVGVVALAGCVSAPQPDPKKIVIEEVRPEKGKVVIDTTMDVLFFPYHRPFFSERMISACAKMVVPKESDAASKPSEAVAVEDDEELFLKRFLAKFDVTWPEGSSLHVVGSRLRVRNTLDNLGAIEDAMAEFNSKSLQIEVAVRFVEVGQKALDELGAELLKEKKPANERYDVADFESVPADLLERRLAARRDLVFNAAPRVLTRSGEEATVKVVTEYVYPTDYDVQMCDWRPVATNAAPKACDYGLAAVEPQSFQMREVGTILHVTPIIPDSAEHLIDLNLDFATVDAPTWRDYGMELPMTSEKGVALPMEQPFFPVRSVGTLLSVVPGKTVLAGSGPSFADGKNRDTTQFFFVRARLIKD